MGGARKYGEPGVLLSFEESAEKVALNVRSLGFHLNQLEKDGLLAVISFQVEPADIVAAGDVRPRTALLVPRRRDHPGSAPGAWCWTPWRCLLRVQQRLDYPGRNPPAGALAEGQGHDRRHDGRAGREDHSPVMASKSTSRIASTLLDHRVIDQVSTRRLRMVKYRVSAHGTIEFPFLIERPREFRRPSIHLGGPGHRAFDERVSERDCRASMTCSARTLSGQQRAGFGNGGQRQDQSWPPTSPHAACAQGRTGLPVSPSKSRRASSSAICARSD